jgi:DNA-binding HxlR family transcriptional regulator
VHRESYSQVPPTVVYSLTDRGRGLLPIMEAMIECGRDYLVPAGGRPEATNGAVAVR